MFRIIGVAVTIVFALAGQHTAAAGEPARPRTIHESARLYLQNHPDALAQARTSGSVYGRQRGFPVKALLVGLGLGCAAGVYWVQSESEGHGDQGKNKLLGCAYLGSVGAVAAVMIARH